jgi:aminoglycoside N3'-acetyltransferase
MQPVVARDEIVDQLRALGVAEGGVLVVHMAFSKVRPVEGGPQGLIDALQAALGPTGTLAMPSLPDVDDEPFRLDATPCLTMGVVADTFWRLPGVVRSDSPHSFAARGPRAIELTRPHPVEIPHGLDSPVGRAYELDAQVLLLGVGHDANTTIHLAENLAGVRYRLRCCATVMKDGQQVQIEYDEVDHCCQNFSLMDGWLEPQRAQRRGVVGYATARLSRSRDIVGAAVAHLAERETVFLHPAGECGECDRARESLRPYESASRR